MTIALSVIFALSAAALYGISSVHQQAAAQREEDLPILGLRVLRRLARRPAWLLAVALSGLSFIAQAVALAFGPLALVQPIAATDLLFALPLLARRHRRRLGARDWLAAAMVVGGVAGFLSASPPSAGSSAPSVTTWVVLLASVAVLVSAVAGAAIAWRGVRRTALLATSGGLMFAAVDALTKGVVGAFDARGLQALASFEPYALLVAGIAGTLLAQGAYRAGSLVTSLPVIDTVEPVAAVLIGATAFSEHLGGSPALWFAQLGAGALAVVGIVLLARSALLEHGGEESDPAHEAGWSPRV